MENLLVSFIIASIALCIGVIISSILLLRKASLILCLNNRGLSFITLRNIKSQDIVCFKNLDELKGYLKAHNTKISYNESELSQNIAIVLAYRKVVLTLILLTSMIMVFQLILLIVFCYLFT